MTHLLSLIFLVNLPSYDIVGVCGDSFLRDGGFVSCSCGSRWDAEELNMALDWRVGNGVERKGNTEEGMRIASQDFS